MAYTELDDALIVIGEPTKKEIFQTIKDNQESFNTDIEALKQTSRVTVFNCIVEGGMHLYTEAELQEFLPVFVAPLDFTMDSAVITLMDDSGSTGGDLEIMIDVSTDNGANWSPVLSSALTVTGTAAQSQSGALNFIDVPSQDVSQNDMIRFRIVSTQEAQGAFQFTLSGEAGSVS